MTIQAVLIGGFIVGLLIGLLAPDRRTAHKLLCVVPIGMIAYVAIWQWQHPENVTSTSGLDFIFGPLWPSLGAGVGYAIGVGLRWIGRRLRRVGR